MFNPPIKFVFSLSLVFVLSFASSTYASTAYSLDDVERLGTADLELSGSKFNQQVADSPEFANLTQLQALTLNQSEITFFPTAILSFTGLTALDIKDAKIGKIPSDITRLENLRHLGVVNAGVSSVPVLNSLTKLTSLNLSRNNLADLNIGNRCPVSLIELNLHSNKFSAFPRFFDEMLCLNDLDLSENNIVELTGILLKNLPSCRVFKLSGNSFKAISEDIAQMKSLVFLDFDSCKALKSLPASLCQLGDLKNISLNNTELATWVDKVVPYVSRMNPSQKALEKTLSQDERDTLYVCALLQKLRGVTIYGLNSNFNLLIGETDET